MAREINTREIVCLSVLRGKSSKESCEEVRAGDQQNIQSELYRQPAVSRKESDPNAVPGARGSADEFCRAAGDCEFSAKYDPPLTERALRQLANAANIDQDVVVQKHQERHEHHMRAQVGGIIVDRWTWSLY